MTADWASVINTMLTTAGVLWAAWLSYQTYRTRRDIRTVEVATNSMKDALVEAVRKAAMAQGRVEGAAAQKAADKKRRSNLKGREM